MTEFPRLFAYDAWANREVLAALRKSANPPQRTIELLAHIIAAQRLWHARIHLHKIKVEVWPTWPLEQCDAQLKECEALWASALARLSSEELLRRVEYTNSLGERWSNTVADILQHLVFHGAYHRGQIATHMRNAGLEPAYTDFIHAVRQGHVTSD